MASLSHLRQRNGSLRAEAFQGLQRAHLDRAIEALDAGIDHPFGPSTAYDVVFQGKRYPPRAVFGLAAGYLLGLHLSPTDFSSGEGGHCFKLLRAHGPDIQPKDLPGIHRADGTRRPKPEYFGHGVIGDVWQDPKNDPAAPPRSPHWFAAIAEYRPMVPPVPWDRDGEKLEKIKGNRFAVAVRELSDSAYAQILGVPPTARTSTSSRSLATPIENQQVTLATVTLLPPRAIRGAPGVAGSVSPPRRSLRSKAVGDRGERLVLRVLQEQVAERGWKEVQHVAAEGLLPGWDIQYYDKVSWLRSR